MDKARDDIKNHEDAVDNDLKRQDGSHHALRFGSVDDDDPARMDGYDVKKESGAWGDGEIFIAEGGKDRKTPASFWILSLKILAGVFFVATVVIGLVRGISIFIRGSEFAGLLVFLGFSFSAFVILAFVMVFLNLAQDMMEVRGILGKIRRR